jgi:hypothetical protein
MGGINGCVMCMKEKMNLKFKEKNVLSKIKNECKKRNYTFLGFEGGKYKNNRTKVLLKCNLCSKEKKKTYSAFMYRKEDCSCVQHQKLKKTTQQFVKESILVHQEDYDYSKTEYIDAKTKVCIIHKKCGKEFWQIPNAHLSGCGCPYCNKSRLENAVEKFLKEKNVFFIQSYRGFDWLKNINKLELDFYLPEYNIGIECQGMQHFIPVGYFNGKEKLEYTKKNDIIKNNLCKNNGLSLYYINYNDNIEDKINDILKEVIN